MQGERKMENDLAGSGTADRMAPEGVEERRQEYIARLHEMIDGLSEEDLSYVFDVVEVYINCRKRQRAEEKGNMV